MSWHAIRLEAMGIRRYEISNFTRKGHESLHNQKYWQLDPYVCFGADAHSFDGNLRGQNVEAAADYVRNMNETGTAIADSVKADLFDFLRLTRQGVLLSNEVFSELVCSATLVW